MRVINRTAVTVVGAQPYLEWTRATEADVNRGSLTVARARTFGSAYLLPEVELEEDVQEWIEENADWLFEFQLSAWTEDESTWPSRTSRETIFVFVAGGIFDSAALRSQEGSHASAIRR